MVHRRFHYDRAFEHYLRSNQIPYVAVDEAKRALGPTGKLKNFDFVVYGSQGVNLLVDVKGRKHAGSGRAAMANWVPEADAVNLMQWQTLFGRGFIGVFAFLYWCADQPVDALYHEVFEFGTRWYTVLGCEVAAYRRHMKPRSPRWQTVCVPTETFVDITQPFKQML